MNTLYLFASGPLFVLCLLICVTGSIWRTVSLLRLSRAMDPPVHTGFRLRWALSSIGHWLLPLNITARTNPWVTLAGFAFHACFLLLALFLSAHVILWQEALGISWWTLPASWSEALTIACLAAAAFFAVRRAVVPRVKVLSTTADWIVLLLAVLPVLSGFLAYHQWGPYRAMMLVHVLSGDALLLAIPFTKLSHLYLFFVSRMITGSDFGKREVGAW